MIYITSSVDVTLLYIVTQLKTSPSPPLPLSLSLSLSNLIILLIP